GRFTISRDDSR
nr:immunoglobulin heavy chain junction region [Homo sapiens]